MEINIGAKIKKLRMEKDILQKDLANDLGLSQQTISLYESNNRQPSYDILVAIADYFQVTTDFLLGRENMDFKNENINIERRIGEILKEKSEEVVLEIGKLLNTKRA